MIYVEEVTSDGRGPDSQLWDMDLGEALVGLRFQDVNVPQGATIASARIVFVARDSDSIATDLTIDAELSDNAAPFDTSDPDNVKNRTYTNSPIAWNAVPAWTSGQTGADYTTPELKTIVQDIVNRGGWSRGNAMVFKIDGTGERDAYPRDDSSTLQPVLYIDIAEDQGKRYYGYFSPDHFYEYDSGAFVPVYEKVDFSTSANSWTVYAYNAATDTLSTSTTSLNDATITASGYWDGNFLNWLTMRRADILRKVLVGGLVDESGGNIFLNGENPNNGSYSDAFSKTINTSGIFPLSPYHGNYTYTINNAGNLTVGGSTFDIRVQKELTIEANDFNSDGTDVVGVLQRIGDKARYGNIWFNNGGSESGGTVENTVGGTDLDTLVASLRDHRCTTSTPLAETLYVATQYFSQVPIQSGLSYPSDALPSPVQRGGSNDPFLNQDTGEMIYCAKSFIIFLSDGASTSDSRIPNSLKDYDNDGNDSSTCTDCGTDFMDDVAFYAHTQDLRDDLSGTQNITLYTIYAFDNDPAAKSLLRNAARNGAFEDRNGNGRPDLNEEWDEDGDGDPDTYFEATDGYALEANLIKAFNDISEKAASGTASSVLATNNQGAGITVQAYFKPVEKDVARTKEAHWLGFMQAFWVDPWGNLREDSYGEEIDGALKVRKLNLRNTTTTNTASTDVDKIIEFFSDGTTVKARIFDQHWLYNPAHGDEDYCLPPEDCTTHYDEFNLSDIEPLFEVSENLSVRDPDTRTIFTFIDKDQDEVVDTNEVISFDTSMDSALAPYLGVQDNTRWGDSGAGLGNSFADRITNIINWVRGTDVAGLRNRTLDSVTWRLGDIVNSTPMMVGAPKEFYHQLYEDLTYIDFIQYAQSRESVIYVGANDGMMHAFTSWTALKDDDGNTQYA